jgi:hypothetical protein
MQNFFEKFCIIKISREKNIRANNLARIGLVAKDGVETIEEPMQILLQPTITKITVLAIAVMAKWVEELVEYLEKGTLLAEKNKAVQLKTKATGLPW